MVDSILDLWQQVPSYRILAGVVLLYIAGRAALDATVDARSATAARLAWTVTLPVGLVAVVAVLMRRPEVAVGVLFATSVAALALVNGLCAFLAPTGEIPGMARRVWIFLIPLSMLTLVAGFTGHLTLTHAAIFALQGGFIYYVRTDPVAMLEDDPIPALLNASERPVKTRQPWRLAELVLAGAVAAIAGYLLIEASHQPTSPLVRFSDALLAVGVLSPILLLPMVGVGAALSQRGRTIATAHASVLLTVLNLCVLLPVVIALWYFRPMIEMGWTHVTSVAVAGEQPVTTWLNTPPPFPMSSWRIDSVVLLILAVAALPVALNRLPLGRREGMGLVVLYTVYLVANALLGTRY
jgi:Ca2+/Na+ antiporter